MNKKWILTIIIVLTLIAITIIIIFKNNTRYNKLVINKDKWNYIINNKNISTSIILKSIEFNDYNLLIDNKNNIIYYSIVDSNNKYNPWIKYKTNQKVSIAINENITDNNLESIDNLKILLYNNHEYKIYSLVATKYPILNITIKDNNNITKKENIDIYLFDNHIDSPIRLLKSEGILRVIEEDKEYSFSLKKESLGHNKRKNHISIFGMEKRDEYIIKATDITDERKKYLRFFINNEYKGIYTFKPQERRINNFEQNKENNK